MNNSRNEYKQKRFLTPPEYPGGVKALNDFIKSNIRIPEDAIRNKIKGVVHLQLEIDYRGIVIRVSVRQSLGFGCDEEALRIAKSLHFLPSHNRKVRVGRKIKLNIPFDANASSFQISYEISPEKPETNNEDSEKQEKKPNAGYGYTINFD